MTKEKRYNPTKPVKVRANSAIAKTVRAHLMMRLLEPNFETCPITRLVAAKQKIGIPAKKEIALVLKLNSVFRIGINGLITTRPARIFKEAKKIGVPTRSLLFIDTPFSGLRKYPLLTQITKVERSLCLAL